MSVYDIFFVFGKPGTYVLDHPKRCTRRNIPQGLSESFEKHPVQKIKSLALDANDNYFCAWTKQGGNSTWCFSGRAQQAYPILDQFVDQRNPNNFRVSFGSDMGDYFAVDGMDGVYRHRTTKGLLGDSLKDTMNKTNVKVMALGINDSYVVILTNGSFYWKCSNSYPDLARLLESDQTSRGDLLFVALNPHRKNEYFAVLANGQVHIRASAVCEQDVVQILSDYPNLEVISSEVTKYTRTVSTTVGIPKVARRSEFLQGVTTATVGGVASAAITGVFSACTIM